MRCKTIASFVACFAAAAAFLTHAHAQQRMLKYSSGTGFFVSAQGHVITNAHVVPACQELTLGGAVSGPARIIGVDKERDLAVLKYDGRVPRIAPIRWNLASLRIGQDLTVAGYPGRSGFEGQLTYVKAKLLGMQGPQGEPNFLQFSNSAQKGNSGGPLLDMSGNVIGVVTGKTQLYQYNQTATGNTEPVLVKEADVAVTIPFLRKFLYLNNVHFNIGGSGMAQGNERNVAQTARNSIVHVRCLQGVQ